MFEGSKTGRPASDTIFSRQLTSASNLKNVLSTAFSMRFILVPVWGKAPFPQTGTRMKRVGFYAKFNVEVYHHHGTSHQDSCGTRKAFSSPPGRSSFSWITTLCTLQKDWSFLLPNSPRKVHFWMHDWHVAFCWLCRFSFKWVQQWPSMPMARIASCVSTNDCVNCKKTDHFFLVPISPRKVHFWIHDWCAALCRLSFSLQTSTMMAIHAYGKDCLLFYYQWVFTRNSTVVFVEMVYACELYCLVFVLMSTTHLMTLVT
jgi:hypothetical protein